MGRSRLSRKITGIESDNPSRSSSYLAMVRQVSLSTKDREARDLKQGSNTCVGLLESITGWGVQDKPEQPLR